MPPMTPTISIIQANAISIAPVLVIMTRSEKLTA
jgi:hypothetical protein